MRSELEPHPRPVGHPLSINGEGGRRSLRRAFDLTPPAPLSINGDGGIDARCGGRLTSPPASLSINGDGEIDICLWQM